MKSVTEVSNFSSMPQRLLSLDVFRGLTILLMILVNSPGNSEPFPLLDHALWNGFTFADAVFPAFLFIVGLTLVVSLNKLVQKGMPLNQICRIVLKRAFILFVLGVLINIFPTHYHWESIRFYGILQRIACCYCIASFIYLFTNIRTQIVIFAAILLGYWFLLTQIPLPGLTGVDQLAVENNWVAYFEQLLFSPQHLLAKTYDPEGFLSTFPAIATTLSGVLTAHILLSARSNLQKWLIVSLMAGCFLLIGWLWHYSFPFNKNLWTSSFVFWSSGWALLAFGICFFLIDLCGYSKWALPLKIFGMNALFAFILHVLLLKLQHSFSVTTADGSVTNLKFFISDYCFGAFSKPVAALLYALLFLLLNFLVVLFLYRKRIFIRI